MTWIKQVGCTGSNAWASGVDAVNDINHLVDTHQLHPVNEGASYSNDYSDWGTAQCYTYSAPVQGQYLDGCVDECLSFETLQEAEDHCDTLPDCGGVSHSMYGEFQFIISTF